MHGRPLVGTDVPPTPQAAQGELPIKSAEIWNRALDYVYVGPRAEGDRPLYDLLMLDNVAQNGGLLQVSVSWTRTGLRPPWPRSDGSGWTRWPTASSPSPRKRPASTPGIPLRFLRKRTYMNVPTTFSWPQGSDLIDPAFEQKLAEKPDALAGSAG